MPQLGLGLGLHKSSFLSMSAYKKLLKSSSWFIEPYRASGVPRVPLAPRTLPNGVSNGEYTPQNVSVDKTITSGNVGTVVNRTNYAQAFVDVSIFNPPTIPFNGTIQGTVKVEGWTQKAESTTGAYVPNLFSTRADGSFVFDVPLNTTLTQAQAILAGTVIRYQLATPIDRLNQPLLQNPQPPRTLPNGVQNDPGAIRVSGDVVVPIVGDWSTVNNNATTMLFLVTSKEWFKNGSVLINGEIASSNPIFRNYNCFYDTEILEGICSHNNIELGFMVRINRTRLVTQDVGGFKAWLAQNPMTIRYQLATPITEPFPNPMVDLSGVVGKNLFDPVNLYAAAYHLLMEVYNQL